MTYQNAEAYRDFDYKYTQDHLACGREVHKGVTTANMYSFCARYGVEGFQYTSHLILTATL